MKLSTKHVRRKASKQIPQLRFQGQRLSPFAGLVLFQVLISRLDLRARLRKCFRHLEVAHVYSPATIVLGLVVHIIMGFRELSDVKFYRDDPVALRTWSLKRLPNVSTISRVLSSVDLQAVGQLRTLTRELVLTRLGTLTLRRVTLDFDGSLIGTNRWAEGTAVGFNPKKKGQRSYYPLFCTIAQTSQVFDVMHRSGNVHDSQGCRTFLKDCILHIRSALPKAIIEVRMDSAFFSKEIADDLDGLNVEFAITVPFARFTQLKDLLQGQCRWHRLNSETSYFELDWKPKSWQSDYRFLAVRTRNPIRQKGPVQLDLFTPHVYGYDFKVVLTNKKVRARSVVAFHNGRGAQEAMFGEMKSQGRMGYVPSRRLLANQTYFFASILAHNLTRELQMQLRDPERTTTPKRSALWPFEKLATIRHKIVRQAGILTKPNGKWTITFNANDNLEAEMINYLNALEVA
jgi:hypothetical protein